MTTQPQHKNASRETLLDDFIVGKLKDFIPPTRKGLKKGDLIGPSSGQYLTSLMSLKAAPIKEIAKLSKVSYNVLGNWRIKKGFRKLIDGHAIDFTNIFIDRLKERVGEKLKAQDKLLERPIEEIAACQESTENIDEFADMTVYSGLLRKKLRWALVLEITKQFMLFYQVKKIKVPSFEDFLKNATKTDSKAGKKYIDKFVSNQETIQTHLDNLPFFFEFKMALDMIDKVDCIPAKKRSGGYLTVKEDSRSLSN